MIRHFNPAVHDILRRDDAACVSWPRPEGIDENETQAWSCPKNPAPKACYHLADCVGVSQRALKMRFDYPLGEYLMTDFSGKTLPLVGPGRPRSHAEIFVAVLPWSKKVLAHTAASQTAQDCTQAHRAAFVFFKGVPRFVMPDNLPAGVPENRDLDGL